MATNKSEVYNAADITETTAPVDTSKYIKARHLIETSETGFIQGLLSRFLRTQFVPNSFAGLINETTYSNAHDVFDKIGFSWSSDKTDDIDKLLELLGLDRFLTYVSLSDTAKRNLITYNKGLLSTKGSVRGLEFFKFLAQADSVVPHHWKDTGSSRCDIILDVVYKTSVSEQTWNHIEHLIDELFNICLDVTVRLISEKDHKVVLAGFMVTLETTTIEPKSEKDPVDFEGSFGFSPTLKYKGVLVIRDITTISPWSLAQYYDEELSITPYITPTYTDLRTIGPDDTLLLPGYIKDDGTVVEKNLNVKMKMAFYSLECTTLYPQLTYSKEATSNMYVGGFTVSIERVVIGSESMSNDTLRLYL